VRGQPHRVGFHLHSAARRHAAGHEIERLVDGLQVGVLARAARQRNEQAQLVQPPAVAAVSERVNDFATPGDIDLECGQRDRWSVFSPPVVD